MQVKSMQLHDMTASCCTDRLQNMYVLQREEKGIGSLSYQPSLANLFIVMLMHIVDLKVAPVCTDADETLTVGCVDC